MTCPHCHGKSRVEAMICRRGAGCRVTRATCSTCQGSGEITAEHQARIEEGERMRADRISRRLSQREEAKRLGIDPIELAKREAGRLP